MEYTITKHYCQNCDRMTSGDGKACGVCGIDLTIGTYRKKNTHVEGWAIGTSNGKEYKLKAYDLSNMTGYCYLENMIGGSWCSFETIRPLTVEEIRAIKQERLNRKINRWKYSVQIREKKIDNLHAAIEPYNDYAFWTEPIKIGHHSERRHRNLRDRLTNKMRQAADTAGEIDQLQSKIEHWERNGAVVKGDAERKRQAVREKLDAMIQKGSIVSDPCFGKGVVVGVFKKSYRIKFDRGFTYARDKSFVTPVELVK